jgi:hypothetical protein
MKLSLILTLPSDGIKEFKMLNLAYTLQNSSVETHSLSSVLEWRILILIQELANIWQPFLRDSKDIKQISRQCEKYKIYCHGYDNMINKKVTQFTENSTSTFVHTYVSVHLL